MGEEIQPLRPFQPRVRVAEAKAPQSRILGRCRWNQSNVWYRIVIAKLTTSLNPVYKYIYVLWTLMIVRHNVPIDAALSATDLIPHPVNSDLFHSPAHLSVVSASIPQVPCGMTLSKQVSNSRRRKTHTFPSSRICQT